MVRPPSSPPTHPPRFRFTLSSVSGSIANPKFPRLWQYLIDSIAASQMPFAPVQRIKCQTSQTLEHLAFFYCSQCKHADTHTDTWTQTHRNTHTHTHMWGNKQTVKIDELNTFICQAVFNNWIIQAKTFSDNKLKLHNVHRHIHIRTHMHTHTRRHTLKQTDRDRQRVIMLYCIFTFCIIHFALTQPLNLCIHNIYSSIYEIIFMNIFPRFSIYCIRLFISLLN